MCEIRIANDSASGDSAALIIISFFLLLIIRMLGVPIEVLGSFEDK